LEGEGAAEAEFVEDNVQLIDNGGNRERTEIKLSYGGLAVLVVILVVSASAAIGLGIYCVNKPGTISANCGEVKPKLLTNIMLIIYVIAVLRHHAIINVKLPQL